MNFRKVGVALIGIAFAHLSVSGQLYGQWPMQGSDDNRSGKRSLAGNLSAPHTAGSLKWSYSFASPWAASIYNVAVGEYLSSHDYRIYATAGYDVYGRLYCLRVTYDSGSNTFTVNSTPEWTYDLDGGACSAPVLGMAGGTKAVYISDECGHLHCIRESDGARLWRSAQLASTETGGRLSAPLYTETNHDAQNEAGHRVYVARVLNNGYSVPSKLFAFETTYSGNPGWQVPEWELTQDSLATEGVYLDLPARGTGSAPSPDSGDAPFIYVSTEFGSLEKVYDFGDSASRLWVKSTGLSGFYQTACGPLVVTNGAEDRVYLGMRNQTNDPFTGAMLCIISEGTYGWSPTLLQTVKDTHVPPNQGDMGMIDTPGCTDKGSQPTVFFLTNPSEFNGNGSLDRVVDLDDHGAGTKTAASSTVYGIGTCPVFIVKQSGQNYLFWVSHDGKFNIASRTGAFPIGWPKTLSLPQGTSLSNQHGVVDADGAVIFVSGNNIRCHWGS